MPQIAVVVPRGHVTVGSICLALKQETVVSKIICGCSESRAKMISRLGSNGGSR